MIRHAGARHPGLPRRARPARLRDPPHSVTSWGNSPTFVRILYPALTRLERAGAVVGTEGSSPEGAERRPATAHGSLSGELRPSGPTSRTRPGAGARRCTGSPTPDAALRRAPSPAGAADEARSFGLRLAFARYLPPQARLALLERRRALWSNAWASPTPPRTPGHLRTLGHRAHRRRGHPRHHLARPPHRGRTGRRRVAGTGSGPGGQQDVRQSRKRETPNDQPPGRDRRRRELRQLARPGRRVLPRRRSRRRGPRADARRAGGYHVRDVEFVAAFDVDRPRWASTSARRSSPGTTTPSGSPRWASCGVTVQRGPTFDGLGKYYREIVEESPAEPVDVAQALREARADVLVSYLRSAPSRRSATTPRPPRRRRGLRQRHPRVHRLGPRVGRQVPRRRRADRG